MGSWTRTIDPCWLNKGFNTKFPEGYLDLQAPDEGCIAQLLKHNNKDEENSLNVNNANLFLL